MNQPDDPGIDWNKAQERLVSLSRTPDDLFAQAISPARFLYIAIILNSALYLVGVFIAGLVTNHPEAWRLALTALGVCYISPSVQIAFPKAMALNIGIVSLSIVLAVCAGVALFL